MKSTMTAVAAVMIAAALGASPAAAQYKPGAPNNTMSGTTQPAPNGVNQGPGESQQAQANLPQPKTSREAQKALIALEAAVKANNGADVAAKAAEADAVAKTADDRYMIAALQYKYAAAAKDDALRVQAIEKVLASGFAGAPAATLYTDLGETYTRLKQPQRALDAFQHAMQLQPNDVALIADLAEASADAGKAAEAVSLLQKGIALQSVGGAKAPENWYNRAITIAYKAKLPQVAQLARDRLSVYPSATSWHDALAIYQNMTPLDESATLDLLRLKRATGGLDHSDYFKYGTIAVQKGFPGEAKAILEQDFTVNAGDKGAQGFSELYALAVQRSKGDRESLAATPPADSNAHRLMVVGDAYYGYGDFAKAAAFYRAALAKSDADANVGNLHLGMALAGQGDKAGAAEAFKKVGGSYADLAKYWLLYVGAAA